MRNALILLAVIALLIVTAGAVNHAVAFDVDYVAGTVTAVSLFWVAVVVAGVIFVAGVAAAWLTRGASSGTRRKLEAELQSTYERLREAEALAARPPSPVVETPTRVVRYEGVEAATVVDHEAETEVVAEAATIVDVEPQTAVTAVIVTEEEPGTGDAGEAVEAAAPAADAADADEAAAPAAEAAGEPQT